MGGGIAGQLAFIPGCGDDDAIGVEEHRPDRHIPVVGSSMRLGQGQIEGAIPATHGSVEGVGGLAESGPNGDPVGDLGQYLIGAVIEIGAVGLHIEVAHPEITQQTDVTHRL